MTPTKHISYTFAKKEKLCSQLSIDNLFADSQSFIAYPLRVVYNKIEENTVAERYTKVLVSVSKRKFKRAVKRNRVKRLIREAYRLNKQPLADFAIDNECKFEVAFIYLKDELPNYAEIEKAMLKAIKTLLYKPEEGKAT